MHVPPWQESDVAGSHTRQTPPPVPQVARDWGLHVEPLQQPFGHEAASQVQAPPWHAWPVVHEGLPPHVHRPLVQASDCDGSQVMQPLPPIPQAFNEGAVHTLPLQHPFGHEVALHWHVPPTHCWPAPHAGFPPQVQLPFEHVSEVCGSQAAQVPPGGPHVFTDSGVQTPFAQQPLGHDVASHWQAPLTHRVPVAQEGFEPQTQAPFVHALAV